MLPCFSEEHKQLTERKILMNKFDVVCQIQLPDNEDVLEIYGWDNNLHHEPSAESINVQVFSGSLVVKHRSCDARVGILSISEQKTVLHCPFCGLRIGLPSKIKTIGQLRAFFHEIMVGALGDDSKKYLQWVKEKHSDQDQIFVNDLIEACAAEFVSRKDQLTEDDRAGIYARIKQQLERVRNARLQKHLETRCCS